MIINFGSINIDHVYQVKNLPKPGETLAAKSYSRFLGGKGLNQSVAIAKSGGALRHIGGVGADGDWALEQMRHHGVETSDVAVLDAPTGNAIIFVDDQAENLIVVLGGANQQLTSQMVSDALEGIGAGDWVLFQNETNMSQDIADLTKARGAKLAYSAAPFSKDHAIALLPQLDLLVVNETEAADLATAIGDDITSQGIPMVLVTKGRAGADLWIGDQHYHQDAFEVEAKDTTGAGDTFLGAFMAHYDQTNDPSAALAYGAAASALQVTKHGAATAIPSRESVLQFLKDRT